MNANELKAGLTEKSNTMKDKAYTLQGFLSKVNKSDQHIYGNYYVDFNELFSDTNECTK